MARKSSLTGESVKWEKTTDPVPAKATVGDRNNMAFSGTTVVSGRAMGVVVATGALTELGRVNQMLAEVSVLETPLLRQIKSFGYVITAAIAVISVLLFSWGHWLHAEHEQRNTSPPDQHERPGEVPTGAPADGHRQRGDASRRQHGALRAECVTG